MQTEDIADLFKLYSQLIDLHDIDSFKAKSYANASFRIDKLGLDLVNMSATEIEKIDGIGKSLAKKIEEIKSSGSFAELNILAEKTPAGVVELLKIKGIGPKKVGQIWRELGIESIVELQYACNENRLIDLKGFGEKTQNSIIQSIQFLKSSSGKFHYATAETYANAWMPPLVKIFDANIFSFTGLLRRKCEIIESVDFCFCADFDEEKMDEVKSIYPYQNYSFEEDVLSLEVEGLPFLNIYFTTPESYLTVLFETTAATMHLSKIGYHGAASATDEAEIYRSLNLPYIEPELREGLNEKENATQGKYENLITYPDLKGILHNHTKWSDGMNTLEEMASYCKELGFEYLGICDHSKTAVYANGLREERVMEQHRAIDALNLKMAPFKIFKGIESDILADGSLDYNQDILASFDFIVASVHQNLKMDEQKATQRLIAAIENPYTTILGHPTGRLLLSRPGYPIDYKKVIDACADNGVAIEINAHPYRLDLDWRWIEYTMNKGVMLSINPDAHRKEGYHDMYYGVCAARKGGLTREFTLNAHSLAEIESYFKQKKS